MQGYGIIAPGVHLEVGQTADAVTRPQAVPSGGAAPTTPPTTAGPTPSTT
jgi:hypothetical protein